MLILKAQHSASENETIFINIVFPLLACIFLYFYIKSNKNKKEPEELVSYIVHMRAKIGAYIFGFLFILAFLIGLYKGIIYYME